jgi:hypothetical protein
MTTTYTNPVFVYRNEEKSGGLPEPGPPETRFRIVRSEVTIRDEGAFVHIWYQLVPETAEKDLVFKLLPGNTNDPLMFECQMCKTPVGGGNELDKHASLRHGKMIFTVDTLSVMQSTPGKSPGFRTSLESLLNTHNKENQSNTPDFILAKYLEGCLTVFDRAVRRRDEWYLDGHHLEPGTRLRITPWDELNLRILPSSCAPDVEPLFECQIAGCDDLVLYGKIEEHVRKHKTGEASSG